MGGIVPYYQRATRYDDTSQGVLDGTVVEDAALVRARPATGLDHADAMAMLLRDKRSEATRRAYDGDWRHFHLTTRPDLNGRFVQDVFLDDIRDFLGWPPPEVAMRLNQYKAAMIGATPPLSEATVNRRLAAVRSLLRFAHRLGWSKTDGRGLVDGKKVNSYRDTKGIDPKLIKSLFAQPARTHGAGTVQALRDEAMLRVLALNALRRAEVRRLDVRDFSHVERTLSILGKGRGTQKETISIVSSCADAIAAYLITAGHSTDSNGPLFRNVDHRPEKCGNRLTTVGIHWLIRGYGEKLGLTNLRPHQLRHTAVTQLAIRTNGNIAEIQEFSRHADANTVMRYVKNSKDTQLKMTNLLEEAYG